MRLTLHDATALAGEFLVQHGMPGEHAKIVADHLVYASVAGHDFAGFSRLLPIADNLRQRGPGGTVTTVHETDKSALIDGADVIGYVTSLIGMDKAIALAKKSGVGIVGVNNSWFSGMLRYYVERAARADLVAMHAANSTARVAPHGGMDRLLGTNPIAFAFPADGRPVVVDLATASMSWGDVIYHQQTGRQIPENRALDAQGHGTTDPLAALAGAFLPWGGARGSSLAVVVQALGILGGSDPIVSEAGKWGYLFVAIDPALLFPTEEFKRRISSMRDSIEESRPAHGFSTVRAPGSGTDERIAEGQTRGWIEVADEVYEAVRGRRGA
ncbi:Ldh family oxidoreductase [Variovorax paradoxus]|nr:Ldh family oxidoreductase [Variovorax paradoxus]MBT2305229.1 Ldh family oxidoreductase [Variovorax paradoxus]